MLGTRPLNSRFANNFEFFNEWTIMVVMYHMIYFSDAVGNSESQIRVGYSCIFVVFVNICLNIGAISLRTVRLIILAMKSRKARQAIRQKIASTKNEIKKCCIKSKQK